MLMLAMSFGQFKFWYTRHQLSAYSESQVAWLGSVQSMLSFLGAVFTGRFFDAHGPRPLVLAGTLGSVTALVGIACESTADATADPQSATSTTSLCCLTSSSVCLRASSLHQLLQSPATGSWRSAAQLWV